MDVDLGKDASIGGLASYAMDSHHTSRVVVDGAPRAEGCVEQAVPAPSLSIDDDVAAQQVDYSRSRARLLKGGQELDWK